MEPLWSPAVATGRNRSQMAQLRVRRKQAKTVAMRCQRLPEMFHGKEGVDGSSPSEACTKALQEAVFCCLGVIRLVAGTRRVHFGTSGALGGQARSTATQAEGDGGACLLDRSEKCLQTGVGVAYAGAAGDSLLR
jgi:hypothetical protein